jgi:hypothetical protein
LKQVDFSAQDEVKLVAAAGLVEQYLVPRKLHKSALLGESRDEPVCREEEVIVVFEEFEHVGHDSLFDE